MINLANQKGLAPIIIILFIAAAIGGYLIYQNKSNAPSSFSQQTTQPSPTPDDETANWKEYKNPNYGFQIKYPSDWTIQEDTRGGSRQPLWVRVLAPGGNSMVDIAIRNETVEIWREEGRYPIMQDSELNGITALWATSDKFFGNREGGTYVLTTPNNNNRIITVLHLSDPFDSAKKDVKVLKQMLSTFKFNE